MRREKGCIYAPCVLGFPTVALRIPLPNALDVRVAGSISLIGTVSSAFILVLVTAFIFIFVFFIAVIGERNPFKTELKNAVEVNEWTAAA